jgi:hypothetical protein
MARETDKEMQPKMGETNRQQGHMPHKKKIEKCYKF